VTAIADDLLPLIDISLLYAGPGPARDALAREVDRLLQTAGFLMIIGHRVPTDLRDETREMARRFFHQPTESKDHVRVVDDRGWIPSGHEATGYASGDEDSQPDLKESYTLGPEPVGALAGFPANRVPSTPDGFGAALERYARHMFDLGADLFRLFALALGLEDDHIARLSQHPNSLLGLNWYPAFERTGPAKPNQFRIGPHCDYGGVTILDRQQGRGGLQIQTLEGEWIDAPFYDGAYTINIADLLARFTGDRWRSTPHRVLPPDPTAASEELISLVFFHEFDHDVLIETLPAPIGGGTRYAPVLAGEYIAAKFAQVTLG